MNDEDLPADRGVYLTAQGTGNAFQDGWYFNTTRKEEGQNFLYMWRHGCAFTKWIPSNQFLNDGRLY